MIIRLENIGRRFNRDWIFRGVNYTFEPGNSYAVLGPNGAGKSTLLQVIAGSLGPSEGTLTYNSASGEIDPSMQFTQISFAAPYMELVEEFTLREQIGFHFNFKRYREGFDDKAVMQLLNLPFPDKQIKDFSSGMKQRTRLALAFCADTPVLFLDEPTSNLDTEGIAWYQSMVREFTADRITIIGSNQEHEYKECGHRLTVTDFK